MIHQLEYIYDQIPKPIRLFCFMTVHKIFTPEPTRECCALFHIQYSSKCFIAPTYKHYLHLLKSAEFTAFGRVFVNYVNFVPVHMLKWLNGPCYVDTELRSGILEVKNLQKELFYS